MLMLSENEASGGNQDPVETDFGEKVRKGAEITLNEIL